VTDSCKVRRIAGSQVSTVAGKLGDCQVIDGPPGVARLGQPRHLTVAPGGGLLVVEFQDHVLRHVSIGGAVHTIAGMVGECGATDGDALTQGRLCWPRQVVAAPDGTFYVADNTGVRHIAPGADGRLQITTVFRSNTADGVYRFISALAVDPQGALYAGFSDHTIQRIFADGSSSLIAGAPGLQSFIPGALPGMLSRPNGMAIRPDGALLFSTGRGIGIARPGTYLPCTPSTC
jgi:glucose/arabinose dehydrogenase